MIEAAKWGHPLSIDHGIVGFQVGYKDDIEGLAVAGGHVADLSYKAENTSPHPRGGVESIKRRPNEIAYLK